MLRACRDADKKVKPQLELKLARDVKKKKGSSDIRAIRQEHREDIGLLLKQGGEMSYKEC